MNCLEKLNWVMNEFKDKFEKYSDIKIISDTKNDSLGNLNGIEFNTDSKGGYLYFWGNGYIGFQIVDYISGKELVNDTLIEISEDKELRNILTIFINEL